MPRTPSRALARRSDREAPARFESSTDDVAALPRHLGIPQADFSSMPQPLMDAFLRVNRDTVLLRTMHDKDAERMRNFEDVADWLMRPVRAGP